MKLTSSPSPSPNDFHCVKWSHKKPPNKQSPGENSSQAQICGWREKKTYNTANANFPHISRPWTRRSTSQTVVRRDLCGFPFSLSPPKPLKNRTRSRGRRFFVCFRNLHFFHPRRKKLRWWKKITQINWAYGERMKDEADEQNCSVKRIILTVELLFIFAKTSSIAGDSETRKTRSASKWPSSTDKGTCKKSSGNSLLSRARGKKA